MSCLSTSRKLLENSLSSTPSLEVCPFFFCPRRIQSRTHARPRNTGFYTLVCRFLDPSFGMGALFAVATSPARTVLTHFPTLSPRMECAPLLGFPPSCTRDITDARSLQYFLQWFVTMPVSRQRRPSRPTRAVPSSNPDATLPPTAAAHPERYTKSRLTLAARNHRRWYHGSILGRRRPRQHRRLDYRLLAALHPRQRLRNARIRRRGVLGELLEIARRCRVHHHRHRPQLRWRRRRVLDLRRRPVLARPRRFRQRLQGCLQCVRHCSFLVRRN